MKQRRRIDVVKYADISINEQVRKTHKTSLLVAAIHRFMKIHQAQTINEDEHIFCLNKWPSLLQTQISISCFELNSVLNF